MNRNKLQKKIAKAIQKADCEATGVPVLRWRFEEDVHKSFYLHAAEAVLDTFADYLSEHADEIDTHYYNDTPHSMADYVRFETAEFLRGE